MNWRVRIGSRWLAMLSSGHRLNEDDPDYLRLVVINTVGLVAGAICAIFLVYNLLSLHETGNIARVLVDAFGLIISAAMVVSARAGGSIAATARVAHLAVMAAIIALVLVRRDPQLSLLVATVFPAFAFLLLDTLRGATIAVALLTVVLVSFIGLGVGPWDSVSTDRLDAIMTFTAVMIMLALMMGVYVASRRRVLEHYNTLRQRLVRESVHDALTGLYNRRTFDEVLERELARAHRTSHGLAVLMLDIDYFKPYNDYYGHPAGDEALIAVASVLSRCFARADDTLFRVGGEEFCAVFFADDPDKAAVMADRALAAIDALALPNPGSPSGRVTLSGGLAWTQDGNGVAAHALYNRADVALYRAKRGGRERWVLAAMDDGA